MKILVINAGSSSLKFQLIDMENESVIAKGLVERIGTVDPTTDLTYSWNGKKIKEKQLKKSKTHSEAMEMVLDVLVGKDRTDLEVSDDGQHLTGTGVIADLSEIGAVGHRVLHGGEKFTASCLIDDACIEAIKENIPLGPLHNPANLMGIEACQKVLPNVPQVAVFDTAFHQTMPPKAFRYGLPNHYYTDLHMRKYGFHGTSHRFIAGRASELFGENKKVIVCHLGNGSSLSAVRERQVRGHHHGHHPAGRSADGHPLRHAGSRLRRVHRQHRGQVRFRRAEHDEQEERPAGPDRVSSDMRDVTKRMDEGDENAKLAIEMWTYTVQKYIGSYIAAMNGCDAIIFTAGIGENHIRARKWVCEGLSFFGIKIDDERNSVAGEERKISADDSRIQVWVIPTNEELAIARDTLEIATKK